jgi:hypothetical protein
LASVETYRWKTELPRGNQEQLLIRGIARGERDKFGNGKVAFANDDLFAGLGEGEIFAEAVLELGDVYGAQWSPFLTWLL